MGWDTDDNEIIWFNQKIEDLAIIVVDWDFKGVNHQQWEIILDFLVTCLGPPKNTRYSLQLWPEIPVISTYNSIYKLYNPRYNQWEFHDPKMEVPIPFF